jgi:hypothetical protein
MSAEISALSAQNIEHVLLLYPDKRMLEVEVSDISTALATLADCGLRFKAITPINDTEVLITF